MVETETAITPEEACELLKETVSYCAMRCAKKCSVPYQDFMQEGYRAIILHLPKYDPKIGTLHTFMQHRIYGAMQDYSREQDFLPRLVRERVKKGLESEVRINLVPPTSDKRYSAMETYGKGNKQLGLDEAPDYRTSPVIEQLSGPIGEIMAMGMRCLHDYEKAIYYLYYLYDWPMKKIGEAIGLSESRVSQLMTNANQRIKEKIKNANLL
jgi:RNA polymerase sigma factor for flagellar operon FliA